MNEKKKTNPILWFLFAIVLPVIIALSIIIIVLNVAGFNVFGWMKDTASHIPVVSSFVKTDEEISYEQEIERLQVTIANKDDEIEKLTQTIDEMELTIEELEYKVIQLEHSQQSEEQLKEEDTEANQTIDDYVKKLASSIKNMRNKQAALIFQDLTTDTAITLLHELSNEDRAGVLEEMDPTQAAELIEQFLSSDKQ